MLVRRAMKHLAALFLGLAACSHKAPPGACVVEFDDVGSKGLACTVVTDAECKADVKPAVTDLATLTRKSFTEGKSCADLGYKRSCSKVPIARTFDCPCPQELAALGTRGDQRHHRAHR